jgi:hypothetical protein
MKYIHNKTKEEVEIEKWVWAVVYKDNTELHQYDLNTGLFHSITEIEQDKLKMLTMYRTYDNENMDSRIDIMLPDGAKIFHFYRKTILEAGTENETRFTIYVFGYKYNGATHYNFLLPNGKLIQSAIDLPEIINYI